MIVNLRRYAPHVVRKPNRPDPAPASAATGDMQVRGFTDNAGTMIFLGEIEAGSMSDARLMLRVFDAGMVEDAFAGTVMLEDELPDGTRIFGLLMDNGDMALLVATTGGTSVYLGMIVTSDLQEGDGTTIGTLMAHVKSDGLDVDAPRGFTPIPTGTEVEFPGLDEGGL